MLVLRIYNGILIINSWSNLGVDPSRVHQAVELFLSTGNVEKKYDASNLNRKLTGEVKCFIIHVVLDNP